MRAPLGTLLAALSCLCLAGALPAQAEAVFPAGEWATTSPEAVHWDAAKLETARQLADEIGSSAVMLIVDGKVLAAWGDTRRPFPIHSMRKSLMSALFGIAGSRGGLDLDATLERLGIDDVAPALTPAEKQARVRDLLMARSGVYHGAAYETPAMKAERPARGSHPPGTFWYYNNWDFNVLGAVLKDKAGIDFYQAFESWLARPIGMQDYTPADGRWVYEQVSEYPAYTLKLSARDLARFGWLYLNHGRWGDRQVVPAAWVAETTRSYSEAGPGLGYGYLWWVATGDMHFSTRLGPGAFSARGHGSQFVVVVPAHRLVVVHLHDTQRRGPRLPHQDFNRLLAEIVEAAPAD